MHSNISMRDCTGTLYNKIPKLEQGNKVTDWTPAPEDVDSATSTATYKRK